jgi:hypothetical protein
MAAQSNLKSTGITNLDASPRVAPTSGDSGGVGRLLTVSDTLPAMTTAGTAGGIMRVVRIPSNCFVKEVYWKVNATVTTADCDVGLYYSDVADGTSAANVAAAGTAIDADFFASALDVKTQSTLGWTPCTFESGTYTGAKLAQPIWQAVGLSADPKGFFDVCFTNTSTTDGAPILSMRVDYVMPAA